MASRPLVTVGFLAVLVGLGAADALLVEGLPKSPRRLAQTTSEAASSTSSAQSIESVSSLSSLSSLSFASSTSSESSASSSLIPILPPSSPPSSPPPGGVRKLAGRDVLTVIQEQGFSQQPTDEHALLPTVVSDPAAVHEVVLLLDGDRAGLLLWIDSPSVKPIFAALKDSLAHLFSPEVHDLLDEVQAPPDRPPRNYLTFTDPGISGERLIFVRVRERLFEFHVAPGREGDMDRLVEALSQ